MIKKIVLFCSLFCSLQLMATDYSHLDPGHIIPAHLLQNALDFFDKNQAVITNKNFLGIIDFKQHNSKERFYIVDMVSGKVDQYLVAHGKNSDPKFTGYATQFSNVINSNQSSLGFYLTAETYSGVHGYSLRLDGLSETNSNARERGIVVHAADYVAPGDKIGRSSGCPAVENRFHQLIIDDIKQGSLIYASYL